MKKVRLKSEKSDLNKKIRFFKNSFCSHLVNMHNKISAVCARVQSDPKKTFLQYFRLS